MTEILKTIWEFVLAHPLQILSWTVGGILALCLGLKILRRVYAGLSLKNRVFFKITMPREDSQKDKEKEVEKDFREKISIMAQFFRNLEETREMNIWNVIKTRILKNNVFTLELVAEDKNVNFYVTTPKYYADIVEKQITSYYTDAEVLQVEPYKILPEGNKLKCFYAYEKNPFWFPIKTFKKIENDPLNDLTNVFSNMAKEETAAFQIVISPKSESWQKKAEKQGSFYFQGGKTNKIASIPIIGRLYAFLAGIIFGYDKFKEMAPQKEVESGYVRMLQTKEEVAKSIGEKAQQAGFDTIIRIVATAKTEGRAEEISNNMIVALNLFKDPAMNYFQTRRAFLIDSLNDKLMIRNFNKRLLVFGFPLFHEKKSIMSEEELASLFHFPNSRYNTSPTIRWLLYKVLPPPLNSAGPEEGILLGRNVYRGKAKDIYFADKDRSRHHYIIGKSGTGKSNFISFMARQDIQRGKGVAVIDPHGDLIDDILAFVPKERVKDVIVFDPSDVDRPMGLNILEASNPAEMDLASSQATEIFIKLFGDEIFGPRIQHYFRNACLTLMEDLEEGATLIDVPRIFVDEPFMKYKVKKVTNPVVKSFWQNEYANTGAREREEMIPYFSAKFGPFITNSIMRNTIGQTKSAFNFRKIMDEGKVLLVKLSKGKIGDLNTQLLGLVLVARIQMAAMSRADMPEKDRKDFLLYVDEFQNFATESFCSILSEARKYHLSLVMAHQYINQLVTTKFGVTSTQIRDAVFGNVGSLSAFKVGADDAEYLAKEFAPELTEQDVIGISNYKQYVKLNINSTTSRPFSMDTIYDMKGSNDKVAKIIGEYSRMKYGRKNQFVTEEIAARIGIDLNAAPIDTSVLPSMPNQAAADNPMAKILAQASASGQTPKASTRSVSEAKRNEPLSPSPQPAAPPPKK